MALTKETEIIQPNFENIPEEMKQLPRWICWRAEEVPDKNGESKLDKFGKVKLSKIPYKINGLKASTTNSNTWSCFEDVERAFQQKSFDGIGFILGNGIVGIDIDNCFKNSKPSDLATEIIHSVDSYYEKSVSGNGVHIILRGNLPEGYMNKNTALDLEVYGDGGRYFTVTGKTAQKKELLEDQPGLIKVLDKYFKRENKKTISLPQERRDCRSFSNSELWEKMFRAKNGQVIKSLYDGQLINDDGSGSDQALCNHLAFWTNKDDIQMDSMFRETSLMRDKWDRKTGITTYGAMTIKKAINGTYTTVGEYQPNNNSFSLHIEGNVQEDWKDALEYSESKAKGIFLLKNGRNAEMILKGVFKDNLAFDAFQNAEVIKGDLPWRKRKVPHKKNEPWIGSDDNRLEHWFETKWNLSSKLIIQNAYIEVTRQNSFHPVKEYLEAQKWDKVQRLDTFFIEYLGANDTPYVRAVTRKWLVAAVKRIYEPGCKFDYMPVLVGPQGCGKSSTIAKLAKEWFSDSLKNFDSKDAGEHLQSSWIFEFGELAAMKKGEVEEIKQFITKTEDSYRVPYDRVVSKFPRKCVFIGTTNTRDFLRDPSGNRRFWPISLDPVNRKYDPVKDLSKHIIGQLWAEAMVFYKQGEELYLDPQLEAVAKKIQEGHMEQDPRTGLIEKYLNILLPSNWDDKNGEDRRLYLYDPTGNIQRIKVCAAEIWSECLGNDYKNIKAHEARAIGDILRKIGWEERKPARTRFKIYGTQTTFLRI